MKKKFRPLSLQNTATRYKPRPALRESPSRMSMGHTGKFIIIETTYPNLASAKKLGEILLTKKLAACVQFFSINSMYCWEKKIEKNREILVSIKSANSLYPEIEKIIKEHHSYEIPQILVNSLNQGSKPYFDWIDSNLKRGK